MDTLIQQMKVILGTNFALYFKSHAFHWNVEGPDFPEYHGFLGDFYDELFDNVDNIAEKIRMLGAYAPTSLTRMLELADIEEMDIIPNPMGMFMTLLEDNQRLIHHLRAGIAAADNAGEPAISNFLQDLLDQRQKKNWMLKSITK